MYNTSKRYLMEFNEKMYGLGSRRSVIREIFEYSKKRAAEIGEENVFDFSLGNPSVEPPKEIKETIIELLNNENSTALHGYTSAQGAFSTRLAVAEHINRLFAADVTPDLIYMSCGAAASLAISLRAIAEHGDEVIALAPYFTEYKVFASNAGAALVVCPPDDRLYPDLVALEGLINEKTRAIIVNSPNNPSGVIYNAECIKALCLLIKKKSKEYGKIIYLVADEPYRELVYDGVSVPYLMNHYDNTLVCYSYSKALSLPGERIGYVAVSPKMCDANKVYNAICGAGRSLGYVCAPSLFQKVIEKCVDSRVDVGIYKENRDILLSALTEYGYECVRPDGAFYLFVKSLEPDATSFCEKAKKHELLLVPCDDFGVSGYFRIAYCVDKSCVIAALPAFKTLADEYKV